jgi:hypothetical protein
VKTIKNKIAALLILLFIISCNVYSQSIEPSQVPLKYDGIHSTLFHSTNSVFPVDNRTYIGFHWQQNSEISKALFANQNNVKAVWMNYPYPNNTTPDPFMIQDSCLLVVEGIDTARDQQSEAVYTHAGSGTGVLNARSMMFKPNMKIHPDDTQDDIIAKRPNDPSNPIFGFGYVNGVIPSTLDNYCFLLLPDITYKDQKVFENPWGSEYLRKWDKNICKK